jgi:hypothetical protein
VTPLDTLRFVVQVLDSHAIGYMITGSVASSLQGEPRATHDLDVVVAIRTEDAPVFLSHFGRPQFYLDEHAILEAIETGGKLHAINLEDGDKVDFCMLTGDAFEASRFARRGTVDAFGTSLNVSVQKTRSWQSFDGRSSPVVARRRSLMHYVCSKCRRTLWIGYISSSGLRHWE